MNGRTKPISELWDGIDADWSISWA
jgi:hypothetical protein